MAQRNEVGRALGRHDGRQSGHAQHVALGGTPFADACQRGRLHADPALGHGRAAGFGLAAHIHHVGLPLGVEMRQIVHRAIIAGGRIPPVVAGAGPDVGRP